MNRSLIKKYNVPGPRYTSYPTVPFWHNTPSQTEWKLHVKDAFKCSNSKEGISIYIHLLYCESLCSYCGCHTSISKNHRVEEPYIKLLLQEWNLYKDLFDDVPVISEIHLGGGTPTFFSPENLKLLIEGILEGSEIAENYSFSFEAHPKNTTKGHLQTLYDVGFRRLSLGIQDFDPCVQEIVNRIQPFEMVEDVVNNARTIGYTSINFDLIYGLPLQTLESVRNTILLSNKLMPERIAFYSYAHVPWIKPTQRKFTEVDLPKDEEKRALYELGKVMFIESGYVEIGMDHFALASDSLYKAMDDNEMHRNFMGYTSQNTDLMIGLGVSSISDSWTAFAQNTKSMTAYKTMIESGELPIHRGHVLNKEDLFLRRLILNLMCNLEANWSPEEFKELTQLALVDLGMMEQDGLIKCSETRVLVNESGRPFIRNVCMAFDAHLKRSKPDSEIFSKTI
jgi:oxygen-independent coproporphyrinogen III oxidase